MSVADTTLPHHTPPFCSRRTTPTRPHPRRGGWGLVDLRPVESVGPDEPVQQRARVGVRSLVDDGDQCDYEVRASLEARKPSEPVEGSRCISVA